MVHYSLKDKLVVAVSTRALFDAEESHRIFTENGPEAYEKYQRKNEDVPFEKGPAFTFIFRLLAINSEEYSPIEVVLLSRNSADAGFRAMNTIEHYGLPITRAVFTKGSTPFKYARSFEVSLYLSKEKGDIMNAIDAKLPGGLIMGRYVEFDKQDEELRIAFDFDGIIADDSSEKAYQHSGKDLSKYFEHEQRHADEPLREGPLANLVKKIAAIQSFQRSHPDARPRIQTAVITARSAPAHKRVIKTRQVKKFFCHIST